ncbi:MAG: transcriptional regulator NagR [Anaerolineae bacterium]
MLDQSSSKPLYEQIREYILNNINSGIFPPDQRIPSERALSETLGVNRLTVKRAINDLVLSGRLYVRIGKGTYVSPRKIDQQLETLTSFTEEMARRGQRSSSRILDAGFCHATVEDAQMLKIAPGVSLCFLSRLRLADGLPMAIEHTRLVAARCPNLFDGHDFATESLYEVLRIHYHIRLTYADQSIEARKATPEEAALLQIAAADPILHIIRVTYTDDGQPIEYARSSYCGARYTFQAVLRVPDTRERDMRERPTVEKIPT